MPKLLIIAATHGDEDFSIKLLEKIEKEYPKTEYSYDWIVGNPRALESGERFIDTDLNRCAPGDPSSKLYEEKRAAEIITIANEYDLVIDIHGSVGECGMTTIVPLPTKENLNLSLCLGLDRNVVWYAPESYERGPLVQHVGRPAIEIECGPKDDPAITEQLYKLLAQILNMNKSNLLGVASATSKSKANVFYCVYDLDYGSHQAEYKDFEGIKSPSGEKFYPYMANQYPDIKYYKMKKMILEETNLRFDFFEKDGRVSS